MSRAASSSTASSAPEPPAVGSPSAHVVGASQGVSEVSGSSSGERATLRGIDLMLMKDSVTRAEILWCIESVMAHKSLRVTERDVSVLKLMAPDCDIIQRLQLGRTKVSYLLMFGIAQYFQNELIKNVMKADCYTVGFDESLNKIVKRQQMDVNVRFWDTVGDSGEIVEGEVVTRYLTSSFLGRSRAIDLEEGFKAAIKDLPKTKMKQVSMDGPNVNWAFYREYKEFYFTEVGVKLLDIGSCGLHCVHGGFKDGAKASGWGIVSYLRGIYNLFKDVPARRALYTQYSKSVVFPQKFCAIRWLENVPTAERGIEVTPHVFDFVDGVERDKIEPTCKSFKDVQELVKDPLMCVKLSFFISFARDMEIFLREFQTDAPMVPFLYDACVLMLSNLMERFVKPELLQNVASIKVADLKKEENLLHAKDVHLSFDTRKEIKKVLNINKKDFQKFRESAGNFLQTVTCKIMTRSPLTYTLTKAASSLDPTLVASNVKVAKKRFDSLLAILVERNHVSGADGDKALRQYRDVTSREEFKDAFKNYRRSATRVDHFWRRTLLGDDFKELLKVVKLVCCLSYGNANVERGFSVNAECLFDNMMEESVVARRQIYDAVTAIGGIEKLEVSKTLIHAARNAHDRYKEELARRKDAERKAEKAARDKRERDQEAKELEAKRQKILENARKEASEIEDEIASLRKP